MEYSCIIRSITTLIYTVLCLVDSQFPPQFTSAGDEGAPVLETTPRTIEVTAGNQAVLPCRVQNAGDTEVAWFTQEFTYLSSNDAVMTNDNRVSIGSQNPDEWNLIIENVSKTDAGQYQCMLQSFPPQLKLVTLLVNVPARIDKDSLNERYLFEKGDSFSVVCRVYGNPEPVVQWYAYKTIPLSMEEVKELVTSSETLTFNNLQPSDGGIYRCEAVNDVGTDMYEIFLQEVFLACFSSISRNSTFNTFLDEKKVDLWPGIYDEPKLSTLIQTIVVKKEATSILQCEIESNPSASVGWQRDGAMLKNTWKYNIHKYADSDTKKVTELTIRNTDMSDSGEYLCVASNSIGRNNIGFYVIVDVPTTATSSTTPDKLTTTAPRATVKSTKHMIDTITTKPTPGKLISTKSTVVIQTVSPNIGSSHSSGPINTRHGATILVCMCTVLLLATL